MSPDILDDLRDLHKQATTERSHYYVAKCAERAIAEIERQRTQLKDASEYITSAYSDEGTWSNREAMLLVMSIDMRAAR